MTHATQTRTAQLELARQRPREALEAVPALIGAAKTTADLEHARLFGLLATANAGDYWSALQHAVGVASCCERLPEPYRGRAARALTSVARAHDDLITATLANRLARSLAPPDDSAFQDALDDDDAQNALAAGDAATALQALRRVCPDTCPAEPYARSQWLVRRLHQARAHRIAGDPQHALAIVASLSADSSAFDGFAARVRIEALLDRVALREPISEQERDTIAQEAAESGLPSVIALAGAVGLRADLLRRRRVDAATVLRTAQPLERAGYGSEALALVHEAATLAASHDDPTTEHTLREHELAHWERRFDGFRPEEGTPLASLRGEVLALAARTLPPPEMPPAAPDAETLHTIRQTIEAGHAVQAVQDCARFAREIVGPASIPTHGAAMRLMIRAIALSGDVATAATVFGRLATAQTQPCERATTQVFEGRAALGAGWFHVALPALLAAEQAFTGRADSAARELLCQVQCDIAYAHARSGHATDALAASRRAKEAAEHVSRPAFALRAEAAWMLALTAAGAPVDPGRALELADQLVHANSVREAMAFIEMLNARFGTTEPTFAVALARPLMTASHLPPTLPNMRHVFERTRTILDRSGSSDAVAELVSRRAEQLRVHLQQMARIVASYADLHLALARALPTS